MFHIVTSVIIGYLAIEIANVYRTLIENTIIYNMLIPFEIYNKIMLYFPQFIFFVILVSGAIGFIGVFKGINQYNQGVEDLKGYSESNIDKTFRNYNTAFLFSPEGDLQGKYYKMNP